MTKTYKKVLELASKVVKDYSKEEGIKSCDQKPCLDALSVGKWSV